MKIRVIFAVVLMLGTSSNVFAGNELIKAVTSGNAEAVMARLSSGEKVNEPDQDGWTPLMWAVYKAKLPITKLLLEKGADPNLQSTNRVKEMMAGTTALIIAGYYGLDDQASILISNKAKADLLDHAGMGAYDYARKYNYTSVLSLLDKSLNSDLPSGNISSKRHYKVIQWSFWPSDMADILNKEAARGWRVVTHAINPPSHYIILEKED